MRTTVDIPDPTYRKLKSKAASQGLSVKDLILQGVEKQLETGSRPAKHIRLPIVRSKRPGTLQLTNQQIYEIIPFP